MAQPTSPVPFLHRIPSTNAIDKIKINNNVYFKVSILCSSKVAFSLMLRQKMNLIQIECYSKQLLAKTKNFVQIIQIASLLYAVH